MKNQNNAKKKPTIRKMTIIGSSLLLGAAMIGFLFFSYKPMDAISVYLSEETNPLIFAALMALLPLAGAPITIFLVLVGMIHGTTGGLLLSGGIMLFHLLMTHYLTHSLLRPLIIRLLLRFRLPIPQLPRQGKKRLGFIFMLIPGLPYAAKNYLLALTGMPLRAYLLISWPPQFVLAIPFIILGKGVIRMDPVILVATLGIILLGALGQRYIRQRYYKV